MNFDVNQLNEENTPMRWRRQSQYMLETGKSMDSLEPVYKAALLKADEFTSGTSGYDKITTGEGNQPGVGSEPDPIRVTGIEVNTADQTTLVTGDTIQLIATITPPNAGNSNMTWSSSDEAVVIVDKYSGLATVTATISGSAIVTATSNDGSFTDTVAFTVTIT